MVECNIIHSAQTAENTLLVVCWISHQTTGNVESKGYSSSEQQAKHVTESAQWAHHCSGLWALDSAAPILRTLIISPVIVTVPPDLTDIILPHSLVVAMTHFFCVFCSFASFISDSKPRIDHKASCKSHEKLKSEYLFPQRKFR